MGYFQDFIDMSSGILDSVTDAVNRNDYSRLNKDIKAKVAGFSSEAAREEELRKYTEGLNFGTGRAKNASSDSGNRNQGTGREQRRSGTQHRNQQTQQNGQAYSGNPNRPYSTPRNRNIRVPRGNVRTPFLQHRPSGTSSILKIVFGLFMGIPSAFIAIAGILALLMGVHIAGVTGITIGFGAIGTVFLLLARSGFSSRKLLKRFYRYAQALDTAEFIPISLLADRVGDTPDDTRKYLTEMKEKQYLPQARFDDRETTLILTDHAYRQYQEAKKSRQAGEEAARAARAEADSRNSGVSADVKAILDEGDAYIKEVRHCNDLIPGKVMSDKLYKLEDIVTKIFDQVREHPERAGELHKFMDYYLPTTEKLLHAYIDVDSQPAAGENIETTKKEIEDVIDTINEAFENILDDMFEDVAWDISSDISAMKTMMRQDGLTDDELHTAREKAEHRGDAEETSGPSLKFGNNN